MAWLHQKQEGGNYLIQFRFQGKKYARSLKTSSAVEATTRKARLEETIRLVESGRIAIPEDCGDLARFLLNDGRAVAKPRPKAKLATLREVFDKYLAALPKDSCEATTLQITQVRMNILSRVIGANTPFATINKSILQTFVNQRSLENGRHGRPIHPSTIRSDLRVLSVVWTYAQDEGLVDLPFPGRRLRLPKPGAKPPFQTKEQIERMVRVKSVTHQERRELWQRVFLTVEEVEKLLDHVEKNASYPFIYPMFVMAAHTGARRSELIRSQREDVFFGEQVITIREKKRVRHRHSIRTVPISTRLKDALSGWFGQHPGGPFTFQAAARLGSSTKVREIGEGITRDEAQNYFTRTLAGSEWDELPGWHCLRHSFISNCAAKGIDARTIMSWVGHMTEEMQERYRHLVPTQMQRELRQVKTNGDWHLACSTPTSCGRPTPCSDRTSVASRRS